MESFGGGRYLGFPALVGRSKKVIFNFIRDRVWKRLSYWKGKTLSMADRKVLLFEQCQLTGWVFISFLILFVMSCKK